MNVLWTSREDLRAPDVFEQVHAGLTVDMIMTPRGEFSSCVAGEPLQAALSRAPAEYDHLPVHASSDKGSPVVGLLPARPLRDADEASGLVRDHASALAEETLIGAKASILDFVRTADERPCRLVIGETGVVGLVSLSDLQRLPVRAALFSLVTGLEVLMIDRIRDLRPGTGWRSLISRDRQGKLDDQIRRARVANTHVDDLLYTQFADKATICRKLLVPHEERPAFAEAMTRIRKLRDDVAHASEYASTATAARAICQVVREILAHRDFIASAKEVPHARGRVHR